MSAIHKFDADDASPEQLMARFQQSLDERAMESLVAVFLRPALAVARQILGHHALAEDAVQDTFMKVVRRAQHYDPAQPFSNWFYTILRRVCIDLKRQHLRRQTAFQKYAAETDDVSAPPPAEQSEVLEWLQTLPRGERDVLTLRIVHDLSFADIASAVGISEEAAKKRSQRGMQRLRDKWRTLEMWPTGDASLSPTRPDRRM